MNEIKESIYSTITSDATFISLTGATATDKRLYYQYPIDQIDESNPWITYYFNGAGRPGSEVGDIQIPDRSMIIDIYSTDALLISDIFGRLIELFDKTEIETANYRIMRVRYESDNDLVEEQSDLNNLYRKNILFSFNDILVK